MKLSTYKRTCAVWLMPCQWWRCWYSPCSDSTRSTAQHSHSTLCAAPPGNDVTAAPPAHTRTHTPHPMDPFLPSNANYSNSVARDCVEFRVFYVFNWNNSYDYRHFHRVIRYDWLQYYDKRTYFTV